MSQTGSLGAQRVTRFIAGIASGSSEGNVVVEYLTTNGQVSLYVAAEGSAPSVFTLEPNPSGTKINRIFVLRNPDKMHRLSEST